MLLARERGVVLLFANREGADGTYLPRTFSAFQPACSRHHDHRGRQQQKDLHFLFPQPFTVQKYSSRHNLPLPLTPSPPPDSPSAHPRPPRSHYSKTPSPSRQCPRPTPPPLLLSPPARRPSRPSRYHHHHPTPQTRPCPLDAAPAPLSSHPAARLPSPSLLLLLLLLLLHCLHASMSAPMMVDGAGSRCLGQWHCCSLLRHGGSQACVRGRGRGRMGGRGHMRCERRRTGLRSGSGSGSASASERERGWFWCSVGGWRWGEGAGAWGRREGLRRPRASTVLPPLFQLFQLRMVSL
ncbi:hypothetical protein B0J12DRAFT_674872 [Macrophomina phaseolina]|uniref:Uncharacterized protein n=1 Tax=Macrophomina phaseolina TaxID=35725 RepID=A0ABQ8G0V8_9PEZI|nr:hypothetical protein B0J12DRAFT_674872 [Macrophomina phaseolina]